MLFVVFQLLLVSLAGLLVLDHRLHGREHTVRDEVTRSIRVDPEPGVWSHAETDRARTFACTRRSIARRPSTRHVPATHHPRPHER
jgi:hypothetical protein